MKRTEKKTVCSTFRCDEELRQSLEEVAKLETCSVNRIIVVACKEYVKSYLLSSKNSIQDNG